mgnify:CR=1 FL=1
MKKTFVSVVVPVYNVEPFCQNALKVFWRKLGKTMKSSWLMMGLRIHLERCVMIMQEKTREYV